MFKYAQILNGKVHWIFEDEMTLEQLYQKKYCKDDVTLIDITRIKFQPEEGWSYDEATSLFTAT